MKITKILLYTIFILQNTFLLPAAKGGPEVTHNLFGENVNFPGFRKLFINYEKAKNEEEAIKALLALEIAGTPFIETDLYEMKPQVTGKKPEYNWILIDGSTPARNFFKNKGLFSGDLIPQPGSFKSSAIFKNDIRDKINSIVSKSAPTHPPAKPSGKIALEPGKSYSVHDLLASIPHNEKINEILESKNENIEKDPDLKNIIKDLSEFLTKALSADQLERLKTIVDDIENFTKTGKGKPTLKMKIKNFVAEGPKGGTKVIGRIGAGAKSIVGAIGLGGAGEIKPKIETKPKVEVPKTIEDPAAKAKIPGLLARFTTLKNNAEDFAKLGAEFQGLLAAIEAKLNAAKVSKEDVDNAQSAIDILEDYPNKTGMSKTFSDQKLRNLAKKLK